MKTSLHEPSLIGQAPYRRSAFRSLELKSTCQVIHRICHPSAPIAAVLLLLLALSACSSGPPRPPQPDDSNRRPANDPQAIELQQCRSDLQHNGLQLRESAAAAQRTAAAAARLTALRSIETQLRCQSAAQVNSQEQPSKANRNPIYTVRFALGSAAVPMTRPQLEALARAAGDAPLIVLRGRTDGIRDSLADDRLARERAEAVRSLLIQEGVSAARIRTTWQGSGDHAADNGSLAGRDLNRRVEIEIYRTAPIDLELPSAVSAAAEQPPTTELATGPSH
jgi:outer membrane protein OmpA-like peptidoglycan-associated protein